MKNNAIAALRAADASANQVSLAIDVRQAVAMSAQVVMTGASTGTLNILASNDVTPPVNASGQPVPANWNLITGQTLALTANASFLLPKFDISYQWIQIQYVKNNGSAGTVSVNVNTKSF